jgi:predicted TIM-barrel fold metal-dependent hydrolase
MTLDLTRITDVHIHVPGWRDAKPAAVNVMRHGRERELAAIAQATEDPRALLDVMDTAGVWRVGMVIYPDPDVMGFTEASIAHVARFSEADPIRLMPYGGVHPRLTRDPAGDVDRLVDMGIRVLKIHPPHQLFPANAYTEGLTALGAIYRRAEERGVPVMVHTGTSIFPGARSKYGNPLELDDVAIDFPDLTILLAHGGRPFYMDEAFFVLRRHKNTRLDVSGIPPAKLLEYFPRLAELADRVLWGTDWPSPGVTDLRKNIDQFLALPLSDAHRKAILETNALAVLPPAR